MMKTPYKNCKSSTKAPLRATTLLLASAIYWSFSPASAQSGVNVLTRSYNNQRTGANLSETVLTQSNVTPATFGKLFSLFVDDQIYAGVLYASSVQIAGGIHNVLYVATVNNSVYAFDADTLGGPLWQKNFNGAGRPTRNNDNFGPTCPGGYFNFRGNIGIVGTPVIDGSTNTMYFVTRTVEGTGTVQRLRAIDITTGLDRAGSPKVITATVPGTGEGGSTIVFNPVTENQRAALALSQGTVYIAWGSYCDIQPYHGWVIAYDAATLAQVGAYNSTPNGGLGGIWMTGAGIAFDAGGNLYVTTGNGTTDLTQSFSESVIKLAPHTLNRLDYYTASNYNTLNTYDTDFGSGGPTMLPGTNLLATGGKEGRLYVLNTTNLGGFAPGDIQIPQVFQAVNTTVRPTATFNIHASDIAWNSPQGLNFYIWGENDFLRGYRFSSTTQTFNTAPFATGSVLPPWGMPGGLLTLSANGSQPGSGVLWATIPRNGDALNFTVPGGLYAFNAETLALLWQSTGVGDDSLNFSKNSLPVVANGKVYAASLSKFVSVYGVRTTPPPAQNLALNKPVVTSTPCIAGQTGDKAVNGSYSLGAADKWCSSASNAFLQVDLGAPTTVSRFVVEHAGAGGETLDFNTADFNIQTSLDSANFTTVVNVAGNIDSITTHDITPIVARYVKLVVTTPTQVGDLSARIYEFQIYNAAANTVSDYTVSAAPATASVTAGNTAVVNVAQAASGNFTGNVNYTVNGLPFGVGGTFAPPAIVGSGSSVLSITTPPGTLAGTYPLVIVGTSGTIQHTASVNLAVTNPAPNFTLAATPASKSVTAGTSGAFTTTVAALNGFAGNISLAATGLPSGAAATFAPASITSAGSSTLTISTSATTPAGTYSVTVTGTSGALIQAVTMTLSVTGVTTVGVPVPVSLTAVFNKSGVVADGSIFTTGLDGYGFAYSANLLGTSKSINGIPFTIGPANLPNVVSNTTVPLPPGRYSTLMMLATGTGGAQASQVFTVKYTDGTSTAIVQSLSDWFAPNSFAGETIAQAMPYRDVFSGGKDSRVFNVYTYSLLLDQSKTVSSIVLPANTNVSILAITLVPVVTSIQVPLAAVYNRNGFYSDGTIFTLGMDGFGFAYSANLLGTSQTFGGTLFNLGAPNVLNAISNATITLPAGNFSALKMLGTGVGGLQPSQSLTVTYTDNTSTTFVQSFSDWFAPSGSPGEAAAATMAYRNVFSGARDARTFILYGYSFALNAGKTVKSVTLPSNSSVVVLALTLVP